MFLDEKLENIYNTVENCYERNRQLINCCKDAIPNSEDAENISLEELCVTIKRINNSWCLFCKKHPNMKKDWFKELVKEVAPKELLKLLGWDK